MDFNKVFDSRRRANEIVHFENGLRSLGPASRHANEAYSVFLLIDYLHTARDPLVRPQPWFDDEDTAMIQVAGHGPNSAW